MKNPDHWRYERSDGFEVGVFTGNRLAGAFLVAWSVVPLVIAGGWMATLAGAGAGVLDLAGPEYTKGLVIIVLSGMLGAAVLLGGLRALAGTSTVQVRGATLVISSGVGPLRWEKTLRRERWTGVGLARRGRWAGVEFSADTPIRVGAGRLERATFLVRELEPLLQTRGE